MATKIGRVGLNTLTLPAVMNWNVASGQQIICRIAPSITSPISDAMRLRDQLLGYDGNFDELVVPVVSDEEPRLNGYYRVIGVAIPVDVVAVTLGYFLCDVTLERVQGFSQPWIESVLNGALLTNVVGAVASDVNWFHAVPAAVSEYSDTGNPANNPTRSSEDGNLTFYWDSNTTNISSTARMGLAPASYYTGACRFEQGSPLLQVTGRSLMTTDLTNWRLSNGLVRLTPDGSAGLNVAHWKGATYAAVKLYQFAVTGVLASQLNSVTILRNSPEEVVIRMSISGGGSFVGVATITVDAGLRRGDRLLRLYLSSSTSKPWQLRRSVTEAATAITYSAVTAGGIRATSNDADGNRFVLLSYQQATVNDLVNGRITLNGAGTTADFAIGSEIGGSGAVAPDDAVSISKQYIAAQSESQRVVAR